MKIPVLLFEITPNDLYWFGAGVISLLLLLGAIAGAVKGIKGEFWTPFNEHFIEPRRARRRQFDELLLSVKNLTVQTENINKQVNPNSGSSLNDAVMRINQSVEKIEKHCDYADAKFRYQDETSAKALFEMDDRGNITYANPALCRLFKSDEAQLLEKNWTAKIPALERPAALDEWKNARENKCPVNFQHSIHSGKSKVQIFVCATPHFDRRGSLIGFIGEFKRVEEINA